MITWILDAGFDGIYPLERQDGVDVGRICANYLKLMILGGYDKMVLVKGEKVMPSGCYVPCVDHNTPTGVSLEKYRIYRLYSENAVKASQENLQ